MNMNFDDIVPVRFTEGKLLLLDQTRLPGEEVDIEMETKEDVWDAIYKLKVRGAPAIGVAAAYGLYISVRDLKADTAAERRAPPPYWGLPRPAPPEMPPSGRISPEKRLCWTD